MKKFFITISVLALFIIVLIIGTKVFSPQIRDEKSIFEKRLEAVFRSFTPQTSDRVRKRSANNLWKFSKEFPQSRFADDAKFILITINFTGGANAKDNDEAQKYIRAMQAFLKEYPNDQIEATTHEKLNQLGVKSGTFYIPFNYILDYMNGFLFFNLHEFERATQYYSSIKDKLNYSVDPNKSLEIEIYLPLAISYKKLNKLEEVNDVLLEAKNRFPNNKKLIDALNELTNKN